MELGAWYSVFGPVQSGHIKMEWKSNKRIQAWKQFQNIRATNVTQFGFQWNVKSDKIKIYKRMLLLLERQNWGQMKGTIVNACIWFSKQKISTIRCY